jgi:predicted alpha/beta superfamily hydrolase
MIRNYGICIVLGIVLGLISGKIAGQELNVKIADRYIIKSGILNEDREVLIHVPDNYGKSDKSYPVLYRLDGDINQMLETVSIVNRLTYSDEIIPEMIIVSIVNIDRDSDMWPVNTRYYPEPAIPGAESFLSFIDEELIPYVDNNFRTKKDRIICGQSLSSVFVLYTLLERPEIFDSYIACSAAFPDCVDYFKRLADSSLKEIESFKGKRIFITNGLKDPLDPNGEMHKQMLDFSGKLLGILNNRISLQYMVYENEGHVPFHSLYDGLKFISRPDQKKSVTSN